MAEPNYYAQYLKEAGYPVYSADGVYWFGYNGFLLPAYLPHSVPEINAESVKEVLRKSGKLFARWDCNFDCKTESHWWHVIHKAPYSFDQCSSNTRSKIRRGYKKLNAKTVSVSEILNSGYTVCTKATSRYHSGNFLISREDFEKRVSAAGKYPQTIEYVGVFFGELLVGYSENHIQNGAVFWENIWYDPEYLRMYSSYVLTDYMLKYYLNEKQMSYVSDGCRSLYHETNVQDFFIDKFHFSRAYSSLNLTYSPILKNIVNCIYPFRSVISSMSSKLKIDLFKKVDGLMKQECICRSK
ncbi:hypothetical protein CHISP_1561 [Chitinispirillum alkaliphilum]|nr:hypothetical protein CHISP_1561 [Chitinispirillum alkaliphilum]